MGADILYKEESFRLVGACFEVYKIKGCGFPEAVYQECLRIEFGLVGIPTIEKPSLELEYKGVKLTQTFIPDYICFREIIVEIKALPELTKVHHAQVLNYLKATGKKLGLLVNFGSHPKLEFIRLIIPDHWLAEPPDLRA